MKASAIAAVLAAMLGGTALQAQSPSIFNPTCDSLKVRLKERTSVTGRVSVKRFNVSEKTLNLTFTTELGEYPWRKEDVAWFKKEFAKYLPDKYKSFTVSSISVNGKNIEDYVVSPAGNNGAAPSAAFRRKDPKESHPFITRLGGQNFDKGLSGRTVALWQSHGRYYDEDRDRWDWQRGPIFQTVEDMYTQTYVLPFLIPMLENAGAYVMTPRERDTQRNEIVADNDPAFEEGRAEGVRTTGRYSEKGNWADAGAGFADARATYSGNDNPFTMGTARMASCLDPAAKATWTPDIPERGEYSVYISYRSLPNSSTCAHYCVRHMGGESHFSVNQKMGGGTWIYLGTFEFDKGEEGCVELTASAPDEFVVGRNACVTADAVRFGGGMGKIAKGPADSPVTEYTTSGLPSFAEGAIYWMQWAGADTSLLNLHEKEYTKDYGTRGAWVGWMSGGSRVNPDEKGLGIPVDLSFAFHSDAGVTPDDSTVGTLAIYTLKDDELGDKLPNGEGRLQARTYTDYVQTQICDDIRASFDPEWSRRGIWDKSYSESRTTRVPAMLLELLSHQNFSDMKYGLDPGFRFTVSRAIYKGMLKYLSARYGFKYTVQPLPVGSFATSFCGEDEVVLSWRPVCDTLEKTADPTGYILYTRVDDGGFDNGTVLEDVLEDNGRFSVRRAIEKGHLYSYRIVAFNQGGKSFPSEVLSVGVPEDCNGRSVLIVNNFTRVSAPAWLDSPDIAGFDSNLDSGVPYINEIGFIGDQYQFRRNAPWISNDYPGFGASYVDKAGTVFAGNTFDYCSLHGKAVMESGFRFHSVSSDAFSSDKSLADSDFAADIICGKQVSTVVGRKDAQVRYKVFPEPLRNAIKSFCGKGGNILISGSYISTDVWDKVYPFEKDKAEEEAEKTFVQNTLGYKWMTNYGSRSGEVFPVSSRSLSIKSASGRIRFHQERNTEVYNVEAPDGLMPAGNLSSSILRYSDTNISAATCYNAKGYKAVCFGLPLETIKDNQDFTLIIGSVLEYFNK